MRDDERIRRLLDGDEATFTALVVELRPLLLRLASTMVRSAAVAEETVQETWVAVLEGLPAFEGRSSLKTWIVRILYNRARTRAVREARSLPFSALGADPAASPSADDFTAGGAWRASPRQWDDGATPEKLLQDAETRALVEAAIRELPEKQRLVLELRDIAELESQEVCDLLALSEANQRVLLHRARHRVREALGRHR